MVVPDSIRVSRVPTYSTYRPFKEINPFEKSLQKQGLRRLAYWAITIFGQTFQTVLLASQFSYPVQTGGSVCANTERCLRSTQYWLFVVSQPLTNIRLPTYPSKLTDGNQ